MGTENKEEAGGQGVVKTADGASIDDTQLRELLGISVDEYRYEHTDVWRGQQFYTTLNTSIIGIAVALIRLGSSDSDAVAILFVVGALISIFGFLTVRRQRTYFLEAWAHLMLIEHLLHLYSPITDEAAKGRHLAINRFKVTSEDDVIKCPELWVRKNVYRKGGITWYFLVLQLVFLAVNMGSGIAVLAGWI